MVVAPGERELPGWRRGELPVAEVAAVAAVEVPAQQAEPPPAFAVYAPPMADGSGAQDAPPLLSPPYLQPAAQPQRLRPAVALQP